MIATRAGQENKISDHQIKPIGRRHRPELILNLMPEREKVASPPLSTNPLFGLTVVHSYSSRVQHNAALAYQKAPIKGIKAIKANKGFKVFKNTRPYQGNFIADRSRGTSRDEVCTLFQAPREVRVSCVIPAVLCQPKAANADVQT
jgi:hypothetical protein